MHQIEIAEKQLKDKYNEGRNKLAESEARVQNYQAEVKQLNMELSHSKKVEYLNFYLWNFIPLNL